jgi:hypothetical protein
MAVFLQRDGNLALNRETSGTYKYDGTLMKVAKPQ